MAQDAFAWIRGVTCTLSAVLLVVCAVPRVDAADRPLTPRFERLDDPQPPHRSVYAILEDDDGFLWIGSHDGLCRYDGYEMTVYRHDPRDPHSISNSSVHVVLEDSRGTLWVGTENGLDILDRRRGQFRHVPVPGHGAGEGGWFNCAFEDRQGAVWFGTEDGLLRFDPAAQRWKLYRHDPNDPGSLAQDAVVGVQGDRSGAVWIHTSGITSHTLHRVDANGAAFRRYPVPLGHGHLLTLLVDSTDRFWVHPSGPLVLDEARGELLAPEEPGPGEGSWAAVEADDGTVWLGGGDGLYAWAPAASAASHHRIVTSPGTWLENSVMALHLTRAGALWVGTEGGLYRFDPNAKAFSHLGGDPKDPERLSAASVSAVVEDADGALWVGTYGGGLNRVDRDRGTVDRWCTDAARSDACTSEVVWDLHLDAEGRLWIAGSHLWSLDPRSGRLARHSSRGDFAVDVIVFIAEGPAGVLWLAGLDGHLYRYDIATAELDVRQFSQDWRRSSTSARFDCLLAVGQTLWIGTGDALGRLRLDSGDIEWIPLETAGGISLRSHGTWSIHGGSDGTLWLGTSIGLVRYLPATGEFVFYTTRDGLPGSAVYSVLEDDQGRLWLGTNQGLARFDPNLPEGQRLVSYTTADGVRNVEFNRHAAFRGVDGTLFFGGMDGLVFFHPSDTGDNPYAPEVRITGVEVASRDGLRTVIPYRLERLVLTHRESTVGFEFTALSFTAPERNRYAYRLEGFDDHWVDSGARRSTRYTNIPPGEYVFRVRGSNNDGLWNEQGVSLPVTVTPPFWHRWWFRLAVAAAAVGLLSGAYAYRVAKRREMERLRIRIAGDLHDDLSSDLSGIAVVADMLQGKRPVETEERDDLVEIRDAALRMVDGLRDIVWYIDPEHDTLEAMVRRMRSVAGTMLRGTSHSFEADLPARTVAMRVGTRRNLYLVFKEAVHNVVRHAAAEHVEIEVTVSGGRLGLVVRDDGAGFDPAGKGAGHGLRSMRRRAAELGADLDIASTPGSGSTIHLSLNLALSRDGRAGARGPILDSERS